LADTVSKPRERRRMSTISTDPNQPAVRRENPPNREQARTVLLQVVRQFGDRPAMRMDLDRAFYLAHLYYADAGPGFLTDWPIVRTPRGPGIERADELLTDLANEGFIETRVVAIGPWRETTYRAIGRVAPGQGLNDVAIDAIREAVDLVRCKSPSELQELTSQHSRSWNLAKDGEELNVALDLSTDEEFERGMAALDELSPVFDEVWSGAHASNQRSTQS
jgi:hypothetical protein